MMNVLTLLSFVYRDVSFVGQEDGGQITGFVLYLFMYLFLGGSRGCAIAIVALVTINEDQDHSGDR
jgi:hypothetical protein